MILALIDGNNQTVPTLFVLNVFYVLFAVVRLVIYTLQGNVGFQSAAFGSRDNVLEDPPFGEGWDAEGNDLSKIANDVSLTVSGIVRYTDKLYLGLCAVNIQ